MKKNKTTVITQSFRYGEKFIEDGINYGICWQEWLYNLSRKLLGSQTILIGNPEDTRDEAHILDDPFKLYLMDFCYNLYLLTLIHWKSLFHNQCFSGDFSFIYCTIRTFLQQKGSHPDQMPHSATSDLGIHYMHMFHKGNSLLVWVMMIVL